MAIYHLSAQIIGRSGGKSAVASAAYRAGEKLHDEHIGQTFDYTKKRGVDYSEILAPSNAPEWVSNRSRLWNEVENIEKSKNSQLARELNIALPIELSKDQQIELIRNFAKEQFVAKGMVADLAMHNLDGENPHAHVMLTVRPFNEDKTWGAKSKKEYMLDRNGEKIKLNSGEYKSRKIESTDWNKKETLEDWRKEWAEQTNQALEKAGVLERVDHRSLKDQGSQQIPQIHVGVHANAMEKRGIQTERGDINQGIKELNIEREKFNADRKGLDQEEKQFQAEVKVPKEIGAEMILGRPSAKPLNMTERMAAAKETAKERSAAAPEKAKGQIIERERDKTRTILPKTLEQLWEGQSPEIFQTIKTDYDQARTELGRQQEAIMKIENLLRLETSKMGRYDDYERRIGEVEGRLGKLSRFNPLNWSHIKALEQSKVSLMEDKQTDFGETRREHIEQRITQLNKERQLVANKLPELTARYDKAKDAYDQRSAELKTMSRQKDLAKSKDLLERYKGGEELSDQEMRLVNSFSKELGIKKIVVKSMEWQR